MSKRVLRFEQLEDRLLLAGGGVSVDDLVAQIAALQAQLAAMGGGASSSVVVPSPTVNVSVTGTCQSILPGAQRVRLADIYVSATRPYAKLTDAVFVSTGESCAYNFQLWADFNSKTTDGVNGCETQVASGLMENGAVVFKPWQQNWATQKVVHYAVTADMSTWLQSDTYCLDLAWANFQDPSGKTVPDAKVNIVGTAPTHRLCSAMLSMGVSQMLAAQSVTAGQKNVDVLDVDVWVNHAQPTSISVVATNGKLSYLEKPAMWADTNYDGVFDKGPYYGTVSNNVLTFRFSTADMKGFSGGKFSVVGNIATGIEGQHLQLNLPSDGRGISGIDSDTGAVLLKVAATGTGEGQVRLYPGSCPTNFTVVSAAPLLSVKEAGTSSAQNSRKVEIDQSDLVMETFTATAAPGHDIVVKTIVLAQQGDTSAFVHYKLMYDADGDGQVETWAQVFPRQENNTLYFEGLSIMVASSRPVKFEVWADPNTSLAYGALQMSLASDGIKAREIATDLALKDMSLQHTWQPFYYFNVDDGALG